MAERSLAVNRTTATSRTTATNRVAVRDMGTALRFDGVDDRILIPQTALISFPSNQPMSISAWVKWTSSDGNDDIIRNGSEAIMRLVNGNVVFILNSFTTNDRATSSKKIERGTWANVCGVYDGSAINVYTNGVLTGSVTPTGSYATLADTFWRIAEGVTGSTQFQGIIDEPRIWNRALTATEIKNLYLYDTVPRDGLVAEYLFDEGTGTTAIDTSGNGNDGTITGATYTTDTPLRPRTSV